LSDAPRPENARTPRGPLLLAFGLMSLAPSPAFVLGIAAWIMGGNDLKAMAAGRMERKNERLIRYGRLLGLVGVAVNLLLIAKKILIDGVGAMGPR
jgi:hypothetical protein